MIDPNAAEKNALEAGLHAMAEVLAEIGYMIPPAGWTPEQALAVTTAAVSGYQARMQRLTADEIPF